MYKRSPSVVHGHRFVGEQLRTSSHRSAFHRATLLRAPSRFLRSQNEAMSAICTIRGCNDTARLTHPAPAHPHPSAVHAPSTIPPVRVPIPVVLTAAAVNVIPSSVPGPVPSSKPTKPASTVAAVAVSPNRGRVALAVLARVDGRLELLAALGVELVPLALELGLGGALLDALVVGRARQLVLELAPERARVVALALALAALGLGLGLVRLPLGRGPGGRGGRVSLRVGLMGSVGTGSTGGGVGVVLLGLGG